MALYWETQQYVQVQGLAHRRQTVLFLWPDLEKRNSTSLSLRARKGACCASAHKLIADTSRLECCLAHRAPFPTQGHIPFHAGNARKSFSSSVEGDTCGTTCAGVLAKFRLPKWVASTHFLTGHLAPIFALLRDGQASRRGKHDDGNKALLFHPQH